MAWSSHDLAFISTSLGTSEAASASMAAEVMERRPMERRMAGRRRLWEPLGRVLLRRSRCTPRDEEKVSRLLLECGDTLRQVKGFKY